MTHIGQAQRMLTREGAEPQFTLALLRAPNAGAAAELIRDIGQRFPTLRAIPGTEFAGSLRLMKVVDAFIHAHDLPSSAWGVNRVVNLPGNTASVGQMIDALRKIAGDKVADLVQMKPDARIQSIVDSWPVRFTNARAQKLGFGADVDVEAIIRDYISEQGITV